MGWHEPVSRKELEVYFFDGTLVSLLRNLGSPAACLPSPPEILICVFVWDVWVSPEKRCKTQTVSLWIRCATHSKSRHD